MHDRALLVAADAIVVVHLAYLAFIPLGGFLVARWPRVVWAHLAAVAIALVSITVGFDCPLTTWEQSLRRDAGQRVGRAGFVDQYLAGRVFPHGDAWIAQLVFAACIVVSYGLVARGFTRAPRRALSPHG